MKRPPKPTPERPTVPRRRRFEVVALLLSVLMFVRCECDEELAQLVPEIVVSPASVDLGPQVVGQANEIDKAFFIGNLGSSVLIVDSWTLVPDDAPFELIEPPDRVSPSDSTAVRLRFTPPDRAEYGVIIQIASNDPVRPVVEVPVVGSGGPPLIEADPTSLDFGLVNEGPGMERTVKLSNVGHDVLNLDDVRLAGSAQGSDAGSPGVIPSAFRIVSESLSGTTLAAQASTTVTLRMDPTYEAVVASGGLGTALTDALLVQSDAANAPELEVPVTGQVNLAPQAVAVEMVSRNDWVKIDLGREVEIDGSDTWEPEGDPFTFSWSVTQKPDESEATLPAGTLSESQTSLIPDFGGNYIVTLRATDFSGAWSEADMEIYTHDLVIVLTWETADDAACQSFSDDECAAMSSQDRRTQCCGQSDLDLHLVRPFGNFGRLRAMPNGLRYARNQRGGQPRLG